MGIPAKLPFFIKEVGRKKDIEKSILKENNSTAIVCTIEHDPNRSCYISSVFDFIDKTFYYILTPQNLHIGDIVKSGLKTEPSLGSSLPINNIPTGTPIHNVCPTVSSFGQISRSAGTFSIIKEKTEKYSVIELSSGEQRYISPQ